MNDYDKLILDLGSYLCVSCFYHHPEIKKKVIRVAPNATGMHPDKVAKENLQEIYSPETFRVLKSVMTIWLENSIWHVEVIEGLYLNQKEFNCYRDMFEYVSDNIEEYWRSERQD